MVIGFRQIPFGFWCVYFKDIDLLLRNPFLIICILGETANVVAYGHLGDSNLHLNISAPQYDDKVSSLPAMSQLFTSYTTCFSGIPHLLCRF